MKPKSGVKTFTRKEATQKAGEDPDYMSRSLFDDIESGKFPKWTVSAQIIEPTMVAMLSSKAINIFDPTKVIPHSDCPLMEFGTITLNKNPKNFFSEVEGVSFSPTAIVSGWYVSSDPVLQTRLFAYGSAARYRLGINFIQSEVNKLKYTYNLTRRDGSGNTDNLGSRPSYIPGDQAPITIKSAKQYEQPPQEQWDSKVASFDSPVNEKIDYAQPKAFWTKVLKSKDPKHDQQNSLVENVAASLSKAAMKIRIATYGKSPFSTVIVSCYLTPNRDFDKDGPRLGKEDHDKDSGIHFLLILMLLITFYCREVMPQAPFPASRLPTFHKPSSGLQSSCLCQLRGFDLHVFLFVLASI